jgi:hypothetical protein
VPLPNPSAPALALVPDPAATPAPGSALAGPGGAVLRAELSALTQRALCVRTQEMGIDEASVDAAFDADDAKASLIALIAEHARAVGAAQSEAEAAEAARLAALRAELSALTQRALCVRTQEMGIDEASVDAAFDADDAKASLIALIVKHARAAGADGANAAAAAQSEAEAAEAARLAALRVELSALTQRALCVRTQEMGIDEASVDAAFDADDAKASLIALIVEHARAAGADGANAAAAAQSEAEAAEAARLAAHRVELSALTLRALCVRTQEMGIDEKSVDEALDADDPKVALLEAILDRCTAAAPPSSPPPAVLPPTDTSTRSRATGRPHFADHIDDHGARPPPAPPANQVPETRATARATTTTAAAAAAATEHGNSRKHVMLSYNWDHQRQVKRVYDLLTAVGLNVWMDVKGGMVSACVSVLCDG